MIRISIAAASVALLAGCSAMPVADTSRADTIEARIISVCEGSGLFRKVGGVALMAVPYGGTAREIIATGIDKVCANPERYARIAGTVEWLAKNLWSLRRQ